MEIVIVGTGYVGLVTGVCFADAGHVVTCIDIDESKIKMINAGKSPIYEQDLEELMIKNVNLGRLKATTDYKNTYRGAEVIFIGVGTPELPDGSVDLSYIETVLKQIAENVTRDCLVVVKSTVPIGTNDKMEELIKNYQVNDIHIEIASNPEFLSQGTAVRDTLKASRIIIGTESRQSEELLRAIYEPFGLPIVSVNRRNAEMIKYASNCFLALKISYMNDIANLCELVGADITAVAKGMSYDKRIGDNFLNAGIGFGGSCLPKDTKALVSIAEKNGYELMTVNAAIRINKYQKLKLLYKAAKRFENFQNMKVAVLGLSYKQDTDDLREAPSLENIDLLVKQGAIISAYDPVAEGNFKKIFPNEVVYTNTPEEALADAEVCFIFTEWHQIREVAPETYKKLMRYPVIYDGRNIYDPKSMREAGVEYHSIGRYMSEAGAEYHSIGRYMSGAEVECYSKSM